MHRRQNPHSTSRHEDDNNTSPPSSRTTTLNPHRRQPSTATTTSTTSSNTTTTTTTNAKKGTLRPQRPTLHHRKSASAHLPHATHNHNHNHHRRKSSHPSASKLLGPGSGPANWSAQPDDDKPEMATSFLQYCAMCEKQINVPSNSVLYCSESCRRKDSCKPLSASSYTYSMTSSTTSTPPSSPPMSPRDIVAPLTPTRSSSPTSSAVLPRIPSELHDAKSDLDPTEWKPVIQGHSHHHSVAGGTHRNPSSTSLSSSSEAWTFLSQFHHNRDESSGLGYGFGLRRSTTHRSSAVSLLSSTLAPSLINTPSTMASSLSSSSSSSSNADSPLDYVGHHDAGVNTASVKATRPLPPRHNPSYTGVSATKGVELVVPHIVAPTTTTTTTTTTGAPTAGVAGAESLASSPTDSHDGGVWLKAHRRQSAPGITTTAPGASFATAVLVDQAH